MWGANFLQTSRLVLSGAAYHTHTHTLNICPKLCLPVLMPIAKSFKYKWRGCAVLAGTTITTKTICSMLLVFIIIIRDQNYLSYIFTLTQHMSSHQIGYGHQNSLGAMSYKGLLIDGFPVWSCNEHKFNLSVWEAQSYQRRFSVYRCCPPLIHIHLAYFA